MVAAAARPIATALPSAIVMDILQPGEPSRPFQCERAVMGIPAPRGGPDWQQSLTPYGLDAIGNDESFQLSAASFQPASAGSPQRHANRHPLIAVGTAAALPRR